MRRLGKKHTDFWYLWVVLTAFLSSCMQEVNLEHLRPDAKLVLNCAVVADHPVSAYLSRTWFYSDGRPNKTIEKAEVRLYVNDVFREKLEREEAEDEGAQPCYRSEYRVRTGDKLKILASAEGYADIEAETEVPAMPRITEASITHHHTYISDWDEYECNDQLRLTFSDDPAATNYYLFYAQKVYLWRVTEEGDSVYHSTEAYFDFSNEKLFAGQVSAIDRILENTSSGYAGGVAFSDELINGKTYTFHVNSGTYRAIKADPDNPWDGSYGYGREVVKYVIYFYSISPAYYRYLKTLEAFRNTSFTGDLASMGLAEPISVYSNVTGGTGFLGGATPQVLELKGEKHEFK